MTLLIPTTDIGSTGSEPARLAAVPVQRPARDARPPDLLGATDAAQRALTGRASDHRDAVVWLSEHIATLDRVIYPAAARHLHATAELRAQQAATHHLSMLVRRLHAQLAGDGATSLEDLPTLRRRLLEALREHSVGERDLLTRLREQLTEDQWSELSVQYAHRLQRGPTRPHPHAPRRGAAGRLAYRLSSWADHVLDVLDSRAVRPVPAASDAPAV